MNLLESAQKGTLYNIDCTVFSPVLFVKKSAVEAIFAFDGDPTGYLPEVVYFMPLHSLRGSSTFNYKLSHIFREFFSFHFTKFTSNKNIHFIIAQNNVKKQYRNEILLYLLTIILNLTQVLPVFSLDKPLDLWYSSR